MKTIFLFTATLFLSTTSYATDINAGKTKASICGSCHGKNGISSNPSWPNLAGQKEVYLREQITAFRDGKRINSVMTPMAKGLSDSDISNIAAYYANIQAK